MKYCGQIGWSPCRTVCVCVCSGAKNGRRKALCTTFPGCRSGRLGFLHRDHRVALSGGNPRQTRRRGAGRGGQENQPWEEVEARRRKVLATQHERGSCFQGFSKDHIPPLRYPIVTGRSCPAPPSSSKRAHLLTVLWPGITAPKYKAPTPLTQQ